MTLTEKETVTSAALLERAPTVHGFMVYVSWSGTVGVISGSEMKIPESSLGTPAKAALLSLDCSCWTSKAPPERKPVMVPSSAVPWKASVMLLSLTDADWKVSPVPSVLMSKY
jgi:hypothetical protein